MRAPSPKDLVAQPVLAILASTDMTLILLARSLRGAHTDLDRAPWPSEHPLVATARLIVDECHSLLRSIDHYRDDLYDRLHLIPDEPDSSF